LEDLMRTKILMATLAMLLLSACSTATNGRRTGFGFNPARQPGVNVSGYQMTGPRSYGPPQGVMMLDYPEPGCPRSMLLRIENRHLYDWVLDIDSEQLTVNGDTTYEAMPAAEQTPNGRYRNKTVGFVCLNMPGWHTITGTAYENRYGEMVAVGHFEMRQLWDGPRGANPYNTFYLPDVK
jgi:hypothetical protein